MIETNTTIEFKKQIIFFTFYIFIEVFCTFLLIYTRTTSLLTPPVTLFSSHLNQPYPLARLFPPLGSWEARLHTHTRKVHASLSFAFIPLSIFTMSKKRLTLSTFRSNFDGIYIYQSRFYIQI